MATWLTDFKTNNQSQENALVILEWFKKSENKALNPAKLLGLDSYSKPLFKFIIQGLIDRPDETLTTIIDQLKAYYNNLDLEKQNSELVFFDLLAETHRLSKNKPVIFIATNQDPKEPFINNLPDLRDHIGEQILSKLDFYDYVGQKASVDSPNPVNPLQFIERLTSARLNISELNELNRLLDLFEEDNLNVINKFRYKTRRVILLIRLVLTMIEHLSENINVYLFEEPSNYQSLKTKLTSLTAFIIDLKTNYYTLLNTQEQAPPAELFMGFHNYMMKNNLQLTDENNDINQQKSHKILEILYMYFRKLELILLHSEISEIKTQECTYDLFDLIEFNDYELNTQENSDEEPNVNMTSSNDILRTIDFRRDFVINGDSITIEGQNIQTELWHTIDKMYCYPNKVPLSLFLGILSEVDNLEVFYNAMEFELGHLDFFKNHPELKAIKEKINQTSKCAIKILPEEPKVRKYELDTPVKFDTDMLTNLFLFTQNVMDAYVLASQKNPSNRNLIIMLLFDANVYFNIAEKKSQELAKQIDFNKTLKELVPKNFTKIQMKNFVWIEDALIKIRASNERNEFTDENIGSKQLQYVLTRFKTLWTSIDLSKYGTSFDEPRPTGDIVDLSSRFSGL